jgi:hypothetical protein
VTCIGLIKLQSNLARAPPATQTSRWGVTTSLHWGRSAAKAASNSGMTSASWSEAKKQMLQVAPSGEFLTLSVYADAGVFCHGTGGSDDTIDAFT